MGSDTPDGGQQHTTWPLSAAGQQWAALSGMPELAGRVQSQVEFLTRAGISAEAIRTLVVSAAAEGRSILARPVGLQAPQRPQQQVPQASLVRLHGAYPDLVHQVTEATGWSLPRVRHELVLELTAMAAGRGAPLTPATVAPMTPPIVAGFADAAALEAAGR